MATRNPADKIMTHQDIRRTRYWRRLKAMHIAAAMLSPEPVTCWRCEQPITDLSGAELGHLIDAATAEPGTPLRVALEHGHCNRAAGSALQNEMRRRPRTNNQAWISTDLPKGK